MSFFLVQLMLVSNLPRGQKANRLFPITDSACSIWDVMRWAAELRKLLYQPHCSHRHETRGSNDDGKFCVTALGGAHHTIYNY